ncbi:hypothetical protein A0U92_12590 [Acetobacter aceti]|uniref:Uncharacterized protein n=1 Tax=Acetobacter aceti TaxID=435 RepID=A0A1U9KI65_ACEAC|nr:hypothetical protein A0U92_12590 [Acetobacter aceti]
MAARPVRAQGGMKMSGTKILWGQITLVLSIIVLTWWAATQWTAWELAFQPELGRPWFVLCRP